MELSIFFARLFGLYCLIFAAIWICRQKEMNAVMKSIISSEALIAFSGILDILFGLVIVLVHPLWVWNWRLIITLLGYLILIRGIVRLAFPAFVEEYALKVLKHGIWIPLAIVAALGIILTCLGFTQG